MTSCRSSLKTGRAHDETASLDNNFSHIIVVNNMRINASPKILVAALVIVLLCGCKSRKAPDRDDQRAPVILISLDTVRSDHLSCYGWHRETTPAIDRIAEESVLFTRAFTPISHTLPAHHSLFTSRHPREHKVLFNDWVPLEKFPLVTEALKEAGFNTAAIVSSAILEADYGLAPGFDFYDEDFQTYTFRESIEKKVYRKTADQVVKAALGWLEKQDLSQPFFLFLHFFDAHTEYDLTPDNYLDMFETDRDLVRIMESRGQRSAHQTKINRYDGSIRFIDDELNRVWDFLKEKGIFDKALIIITSDHGEGLGEHGWYYHGLYVYEEQMRIPLIIRLPGSDHAGERIDALVDLVDLAPTILDFSNISQLPESRGKSLLPVIRGEKDKVRDHLFFERRWYPEENELGLKNWAPGEKFGVRGESWKYIWASDEPEELFDLEKDPHELHDLAPENPERINEMKKELKKYWFTVKKERIKPQPYHSLNKEKLKSLGYLE